MRHAAVLCMATLGIRVRCCPGGAKVSTRIKSERIMFTREADEKKYV
eukprot:gene20534-62562_t